MTTAQARKLGIDLTGARAAPVRTTTSRHGAAGRGPARPGTAGLGKAGQGKGGSGEPAAPPRRKPWPYHTKCTACGECFTKLADEDRHIEETEHRRFELVLTLKKGT